MSMMETMDDRRVTDYVLGWMPPLRRRWMNYRIEADAGIRARVEALHATFAPLHELSDPVVPPEDTWTGVQVKLNREAMARPPALGWRWAVPGGAIVAALVAMVVLASPKPIYQAELREATGSSGPLAIASANRNNDLTLTQIALPEIAPDKSLELWIIPQGGTPHSLGVWNGHSETRHLAVLASGSTVAISLEPGGGSPTGAPTGPVVMSGELKRL